MQLNVLPDEILAAVLSHLSLADLERAARVSRLWMTAAGSAMVNKNGIDELAAQIEPLLTPDAHEICRVGKYTRFACANGDEPKWSLAPVNFAVLFYIVGELAQSCLDGGCCLRHGRYTWKQDEIMCMLAPHRGESDFTAAGAREMWARIHAGAVASMSPQEAEAAWLRASRKRTAWARARLRAGRDVLAPLWWIGEFECRGVERNKPSVQWLHGRQAAGLRVLAEAALGRSSWDEDGDVSNTDLAIDFYDFFHPHGRSFDVLGAFIPFSRVICLIGWKAAARCRVCAELPKVVRRRRRGEEEEAPPAPAEPSPPPRRLTVRELLLDSTYGAEEGEEGEEAAG